VKELKGENTRLKHEMGLILKDSGDEDTEIRELLRLILGDEVDGDSYCVPPLAELIEHALKKHEVK
jgi:hypothetical protein